MDLHNINFIYSFLGNKNGVTAKSGKDICSELSEEERYKWMDIQHLIAGYKFVGINGELFIVQSFSKDERFYLSHCSEPKRKFDKELRSIIFEKHRKTIHHTGNDSLYALKFINEIDFDSVWDAVHVMFSKINKA